MIDFGDITYTVMVNDLAIALAYMMKHPGVQADPLKAAEAMVAGRGWLSTLGLGLWALGFLFESVGDRQLARFKRDPANRGRVIDAGLWRYTRHPNYFGDFCVWWGLYLVALGCGAAWWSAIGPAVMSLLLMKVSGVALLEKTLTETKPEYAGYARRTNAFFPWWPDRLV